MNTRLVGLLVVTVTGMIIAYFMIQDQRQLGIYNPVKIDEKLVDQSLQSKMSGHRIGSFQLTDQFGDVISEKNFENKIYVADFFFTTCPGICIAMAKQMYRVQDAFSEHDNFAILSHTVQPEIDTPEILDEYAKLYEAKPGIWFFATGDRQIIFDLARKSYFAATLEPGHEETEMVHTENFVLVDKEKRIRGIYDGTSTRDVDRLIEDIEILFHDYE